jgi:hypothetical protein
MRKPNIEFSLICTGSNFWISFWKGEKRPIVCSAVFTSQSISLFFLSLRENMRIREECVWTDNQTAVRRMCTI